MSECLHLHPIRELGPVVEVTSARTDMIKSKGHERWKLPRISYCVVPLFLHPVRGIVIIPNSHINLVNLNMRAHASVCARTLVAQGEVLSVWYLILPFLH